MYTMYCGLYGILVKYMQCDSLYEDVHVCTLNSIELLLKWRIFVCTQFNTIVFEILWSQISMGNEIEK